MESILKSLGRLCSYSLIVTMLALPASAAKVDEELRELLKAAALDADSFEDRFAAQVWLVDMSARLERFVPDDAYRLQLLKSCAPTGNARQPQAGARSFRNSYREPF